MDKQDITFIRELQQGFKLERRPFNRIARDLNMTEDAVIEKINDFVAKGFIRRIGVAVRPTQAGFVCNALVAWEVEAPRVDEVGGICAAIPEISHCYDREGPPGWQYNFFTMIHATSENHLGDLIDNLKKKCGLKNYQVYRTVKEFKKSSPDFFPPGDKK